LSNSVQFFTSPPSGVAAVAPINTSQTLLPGVFYPTDTSAGQAVTLTFPITAGGTLPTEGMLIGVSDYKGTSASVAPIILLAQGTGVQLANPSNPGQFGSPVQIAQQGQVVWWRYFSSVNRWIAIAW
jgi:hypothetical protein